METTTLLDEATAALDEDGATFDLPDGRTLRLRIEPDQDTTVSDFDCYGMIEYADRPPRYNRYSARPDGFDGNAEKLCVGQSGDRYWWQPDPNGPKRGTPEFAAERSHLLDLLEYGLQVYVVELLDGTDAYGRPIVVDVQALGGIDSLWEVESTFVGDLVSEILAR